MTTVGDAIKGVKTLYEFIMLIFKLLSSYFGKDEGSDEAKSEETE